ncbi:MAG: adenylate kinase [Clostridiales bacterium]|nr:adenylate kinase [Clostridiales bacterium]
MKLVFLGPPGAGKGTQAEVICRELNIPHISTGDMLRSAIASATPTGLRAKAYVEAGQLVPDEVLIDMVRDRLNEADCANGYLLDGFPRTVHQAQALDEIKAPDAVVDMEVEDAHLLSRLTGRRVCRACQGTFHISSLKDENVCPACGGELYRRKDDAPETIQNRLNVYHTQTAPLIDYYRRAGKLAPVDGEGTPEAVTRAILSALRG